MISNSEICKFLGKVAREKSLKRFDPGVIAKQFIELYEKYSRVIDKKDKEIEQILIDLATGSIKTSQDKIKDYLKKLEFYNKEKVH